MGSVVDIVAVLPRYQGLATSVMDRKFLVPEHHCQLGEAPPPVTWYFVASFLSHELGAVNFTRLSQECVAI